MIRLAAVSRADDRRIVYRDFFRTQRDNLMLLAEVQTPLPFFDHVQRTLYQAISSLPSKLKEAADPEPLLQEFFVQLNWQLHTLLGKTLSASEMNNPEHGLSLFFVYVRANKLYAVQFGRLLSCLVTAKQTITVGEEWDNFAIRTRDQMNLIGSRGEDISVKVHVHELPPGSRFVVVSSSLADAVREHGPAADNLAGMLRRRQRAEAASFAVFETERLHHRLKRSLFAGKPFRLTAMILLTIVVITSLYFFQCSNQVEDQLAVMRQLRLYMESNQDPERIPELLGEMAREMLPDADTVQIARMVEEACTFITAPAASIKLQRTWSMSLPEGISQPPSFDDRYLFIVCGATLHAYDKRTRESLYSVTFERPVHTLLHSDANRLQVTTIDGATHSLKRDTGERTWTMNGSPLGQVCQAGESPRHISRLHDRRLISSVLAFVHDGQVQIVNIHTGVVEAGYAPEGEGAITMLSAFDPLEKALYAVSGDVLVKLRLVVR
ncbi:MAG: PQQ-like beta-propeller repeat protein [Candidatus Cloacimonetes bacterium]|nr:PQQ-like beta-propeller repeat protein [Candidatus Cloacimonadota bacterium]